MANLVDIAGVPRQVEVRGKMIDVFGVSAMSLAALMVRFPEIGKALSGMSPDIKALQSMAPKALSAFIAAGCGKAGDEPTEQAADKLGAGEQLELVTEIIRLTFPKGLGPFVKGLEALGVAAQVDTPLQQPSPERSKSS